MTRDNNPHLSRYDVIMLGAGAAGLTCAAVAGADIRNVNIPRALLNRKGCSR